MGRKINIRPTTSVYATYKHIKYYPWTAIAEFVDNSTQSYFDNQKRLEETKYWKGLNVEIEYSTKNGKPASLKITDNAHGMCFEDFKRAIILDSRPKQANRGEFGMGLKTAACWFGRNWSVESTELGSGIRYYAEVDVDSLQKYPREEIEVFEEACNPKEHGTIIRIWNLNRGIAGRQVGKLKQQLTGIYRADLRSGDINIYYNDYRLVFQDPEILTEQLPDGSTLEWKKELDYTIFSNDREYSVNGFVAIRDTASTSDAGFALLRYGRVIVGGFENNYRPEELFEKPNSFVYQRLFGEISLDNWPVTQTKDGFDWFDGLEDDLIKSLKEQSSEFIKKAKVYRKKGQDSISHSFETVVDQFERQGLIQDVQIKSIQKSSLVSSINHEQAQGIENPQEGNVEGDNIAPASQVDIDNQELLEFSWNGIDYKLIMNISIDDPLSRWLNIIQINNDNNQYRVDWNLSHPFFQPITEEKETIEVFKSFIFAYVISELDVMRANENGLVAPGDIRSSMNKLLKKWSRR